MALHFLVYHSPANFHVDVATSFEISSIKTVLPQTESIHYPNDVGCEEDSSFV